MDALHGKLNDLREYFKRLGSAAIAFSGGVDSTFMLSVAVDVLSKEKVLAITALSAFFTKREKSETDNFCRQNGISHIFLPVDILQIDGVAQNPENRCYLCKRALFERMKRTAAENGFADVCEGSNADDAFDYRPGMKAVEELGIKSPLRSVGLTKREIRVLSKEMNLPTWDKPSFACLASRFAYGEEITTEKLDAIEKAEALLLSLGFTQRRVRLHGKIARIEILQQEFEKIINPDIRTRICEEFSALGFSYTTIDLKGFRSGSMNETMLKEKVL